MSLDDRLRATLRDEGDALEERRASRQATGGEATRWPVSPEAPPPTGGVSRVNSRRRYPPKVLVPVAAAAAIVIAGFAASVLPSRSVSTEVSSILIPDPTISGNPDVVEEATAADLGDGVPQPDLADRLPQATFEPAGHDSEPVGIDPAASAAASTAAQPESAAQTDAASSATDVAVSPSVVAESQDSSSSASALDGAATTSPDSTSPDSASPDTTSADGTPPDNSSAGDSAAATDADSSDVSPSEVPAGTSADETNPAPEPTVASTAAADLVPPPIVVPASGLAFGRALCVTGISAPDTLNVRQGPSTEFQSVGELRAGQCGLRELGQVDGNWLTIAVDNGLVGWVSSRFVANDPSIEQPPLPDPVPTPSQAPFDQEWCVSGLALSDTLNLRAGPGTPNPVLSELAPGQCGLLGNGTVQGSWRLLQVGDLTGWASANFLARPGQVVIPPPIPATKVATPVPTEVPATRVVTIEITFFTPDTEVPQLSAFAVTSLDGSLSGSLGPDGTLIVPESFSGALDLRAAFPDDPFCFYSGRVNIAAGAVAAVGEVGLLCT